jgi:hypothetical protein
MNWAISSAREPQQAAGQCDVQRLKSRSGGAARFFVFNECPYVSRALALAGFALALGILAPVLVATAQYQLRKLDGISVCSYLAGVLSAGRDGAARSRQIAGAVSFSVEQAVHQDVILLPADVTSAGDAVVPNAD